ncbi:hypothetical protein FRC07_008338 [Ceratobasidium sp. 392]|nr:hypothetical protein FRC07_008338 [Ceratobasidium sp. 392]
METRKDDFETKKGNDLVQTPTRSPSVNEYGDPLTAYDRKSLLVNHQLDRMGMGRYQWFVVGLCAMGYMLDLLWAQAFGLIAPPLQKELGFSDTEMGNIFTAFSAGLCAGAFMWGVLVDIIGRRWAFNLTVLITSVFGLAIGGPNNYDAIIVLTAFIGLGIGGNIPIDTESPRFLLSKGRDEEAIEVLHKVAKMNRTTCTLTIEELRAEDAYEGSEGDGESQGVNVLKMTKRVYNFHELKVFLKRGKNLRLVLLTWLTYAFDAWGFTIAGYVLDFMFARLEEELMGKVRSFLPTILLRKNQAINVSLRDTYKSYIIIYVCGIPATLLAAGMVEVPRLGRKWAMVVSSALMATSLFLFATVNTQAANIGLNAMEYFFQSLFNAVLYGWTPEAFPAPIRGSACGIASFWGRLFSIIAPLIGARLLDAGGDAGINNVLYLAGAGVFVCTLATALLPNDTGNKNRQTL